MKATEILNKISNIVGVELSDEKIELAEIKLENGTVLTAESFEAGKSVFIKTEDKEVALPLGEYKLEDGKILIVKEEGMIDEIKEVEAEEEVKEEELEEDADEPKKEEMEYVTKQEFTQAVDEIKAMIEEKMGGYGEKEEMTEENNKEKLSAIEVSPIKHNPEEKIQNKFQFQISKNREYTTRDRVFERILNNN